MEELRSNFIHDIIDEDLAANPELKIHTRFPPEPNGYLHIGSAKAIWINAMTAKKYGGKFKTRSTNELLPGMNEISISNMESLKWGAIKQIESVRFIVDPEVPRAAARDCLYFVDMSVYQK